MRAVIIKEHGGIDKLIYTEVPKPVIGPDEVLIKVGACSLNHLDIWARKGMPGIQIPMPHILGCDIAGNIVQTGKKAKHLKAGWPVVVCPGVLPRHDPHFNTKWDSVSDRYKILGFQVDGGYAEYARVPADNVIRVSPKISFQEWSTIPLVFITAWHMLVTRANIEKGETVLIHAAGSGVGSAAIQIAKYFGAKVITTVGNDEKKARAKAIGADWVINYKKSDFAKEAHEITRGKGVNIVLEHIGPDTFTKSLASLARRGRLVTCGATSGPIAQIDLRFIFVRQLSIIGCYMGGMKELRKIVPLVERRKLRPVIDKIFPLDEAQEAHRRMSARQNFGKIVLVP